MSQNGCWIGELKAFNRQSLKEAKLAKTKISKINYQDLYYYSAPKAKINQSLDEVDLN